MKSKVIIFVVVLNLLVLTGYSQKKTVEAANQKYEKYAFVDAIAMFERVAAKGYRSADMFQKLGNAYYFNADPTKAVKWYSELFKMKNTKIASEYYYRYAQSLKAVGDYTKASEIMDAFVQQSGNDLRAQLYSRENDYLEEIRINSDRYKVEDAGVNSEYSDYGSAVIDGKLVFASARDTSGIIKSRHKWTNQSFTSLYSADVGEAKEPVKFGKKLDSRFHESTPVFSKDGQTMYFTRNNFNDGKKGKSGKQITLLKIYRATRGGDEWQNVTELPFNSNNYSVAHPALTPDGKFLYFASDMPGTLGQSDLFRVVLNSDGSYGKPENLGKTINTEGRETFPSFTDENELYFASDGRPGLGGLDIYRSVRLNDGTL
ncbi:MAG TPA: flagellar motor protein MotB, partial [Flavobacterium sp.]|nr:flagellar motor protein MotB [Flavobacterium sp.]